jgi:hypothetical protein
MVYMGRLRQWALPVRRRGAGPDAFADARDVRLRELQPFEKRLVLCRVAVFEFPVPLVHRCVVEADGPEQLDPLVAVHGLVHIAVSPSRVNGVTGRLAPAATNPEG